MNIQGDFLVITMVLLVSARLAGLLILSPIFQFASVPATVRLLFVIALSTGIVLSAQITSDNLPTTLAALGIALMAEVFVGAVLAFGLFAAFGAFLFGGRILDFQMGFGVANVIDPSTNVQAPMVGTALNLMAIAVFFALDGHQWLIRGLVYSLNRIPPGGAFQTMSLQAVTAQFGAMFIFGLAVVAPAVITLLLVDVAMAVAARTMPQVNVFIFALPIKIFLGLTVMALTLRNIGPLLNRIFESIFYYWDRVLNP
jgi:flagellar biosynthetic protein FliR